MNLFKYDRFFLVLTEELEEELSNIIYKEFDDVRALVDAGLPVRLYPSVDYIKDDKTKVYLSISLGWSYGACMSGSKKCYVLKGLNIEEFYYEMLDNDPYYGYRGDIICQHSVEANGKELQVSSSVWPNHVANNFKVVEG